jgi:hypothetical protein
MIDHPLKKEIDDALLKQGGLYEFVDIVNCVKNGTMQSFSLNESWAVTQCLVFPRKRALNIVFMVGELSELCTLEAELIGFARELNVDLMMAEGRLGFEKIKRQGWVKVSSSFVKELNHGT